MGWLVGPVIAAGMCAAFVLYIYDHFIAEGVRSFFSGVARAGLAVGVGASVITVALLRAFDDRTRWFGRGRKGVKVQAKPFPRIKRFW